MKNIYTKKIVAIAGFISFLVVAFFVTKNTNLLKGSLGMPRNVNFGGIVDIAANITPPSTELFHTDQNGLKITNLSAPLDQLNMAADDFVIFQGGSTQDFSKLGSWLQMYDIAKLKQYRFLILASENPAWLFRKQGFSLFGKPGSDAGGGDFCEIPQKGATGDKLGGKLGGMLDFGKKRQSEISNKKGGPKLFGMCGEDDCGKNEEGDGGDEESTAAERGHAMTASGGADSTADQRAKESRSRSDGLRQAKESADRNAAEANQNVRGAKQSYKDAQKSGNATKILVEEKRLAHAREEAKAANAEATRQNSGSAISERMRAEAQAKEAEAKAKAEAATDEGSNGGESTSCVDQMNCGSPLRRAKKAVKQLSKEDVERMLVDKRGRPSPEGGVEAGQGRGGLRNIDIFGQPTDSSGFASFFGAGQNGGFDMCGGNFLIFTRNMMVCDESPEGSGSDASCSSPTGSNQRGSATQIPVGFFRTMQGMGQGRQH